MRKAREILATVQIKQIFGTRATLLWPLGDKRKRQKRNNGAQAPRDPERSRGQEHVAASNRGDSEGFIFRLLTASLPGQPK